MDDELDALEAELRRLRPAQPSLRLRTGVVVDLTRARRPERPRSVMWLAFSALASAAMVALVLTMHQRPQADLARTAESKATAVSFQPVAAENLLLGARDEGLVDLGHGITARRVRESYLDTITWKNPRTNASLQWTVPREEIRVVPVLFQ